MADFLDSHIEFKLLNNRHYPREKHCMDVIHRGELEFVKQKIRQWLDTERDTYLKPNYCDILTLHCAKDNEFIHVDTIIFRDGIMSNLGRVVVKGTWSSPSCQEKTLEFKFKYIIDNDDRDRIYGITSRVLDLMSITFFDDELCDTIMLYIFSEDT